MSDKPNVKYNVLLLGPIGVGKTYSIRTFMETGHEVFVLATEPGTHTILGDLPKDKVHWKYISPAKTDWDTMLRNAKSVNTLSMEQLQKQPGMNRNEYNQFMQVLEALSNFTCDRTGESFGPVDEWGPERVLVVDGLSGLSQMALDLVCGAKPIKTQPEWGVAMDNLKRLVYKLCNDTLCTFVLLAHVEREPDEVTGGNVLTVSTLGRKLAPEIPKPFDEVIFCHRNGAKDFKWSTMRANVDLKSRSLPLDDTLKPTFAQFQWHGDG